MIDLQLTNVSKKYRIRQDVDGGESLARKLLSIRKRKEDFWALKDISFDVQRADALGIIGHNGAGKSTILKLLSRITTPTTGEIMINGRLSALIEVGSGFHPELTGRENIYLNGSILGMMRREITQKLESIVEFAELRQFIDTPVKRYSSGMYVRLGFSIAAHLDPDVLLLDEVLAVGDASFQRKCIQRITELKKNGTTIVFISHDLRAVQQLCDRVILLKRGQIEADGDPAETIAFYQSSSAQLSGQATGGMGQQPTGEAVVTSLTFYDENENECLSFETGKPMKAVLNYRVDQPLRDVIFEVQFYSQEGRFCSFFSSETLGRTIDVEPGEGSIAFDCSSVGLGPGVYFIDTGIRNRLAPYGIDIDWRRRCLAVRIDYDRHLRDTFYMPYICHHSPPPSFVFSVPFVAKNKDERA
ncbi:MAG TPA: ATP-binding cassette domain-containing protein [Pyrinomonadaceae bacterium]|nr:ATP-binding cassette domain-containing protein [Pyrinomonadaceae bacterium]